MKTSDELLRRAVEIIKDLRSYGKRHDDGYFVVCDEAEILRSDIAEYFKNEKMVVCPECYSDIWEMIIYKDGSRDCSICSKNVIPVEMTKWEINQQKEEKDDNN